VQNAKLLNVEAAVIMCFNGLIAEIISVQMLLPSGPLLILHIALETGRLSIPAIFISVSTAYGTLKMTLSGSSFNKPCNEANQYY
jgi:hypothetical protein